MAGPQQPACCYLCQLFAQHSKCPASEIADLGQRWMHGYINSLGTQWPSSHPNVDYVGAQDPEYVYRCALSNLICPSTNADSWLLASLD